MLADLLWELVQLYGPSGYEGRVAERLVTELRPWVEEVYTDRMGNVIARKEGRGPGSVAVMAHMDEVSLVVCKVDGFVWFERVGYVDVRGLLGVPITVLAEEGDLPGVVCSASAHAGTATDLPELWIDVGNKAGRVSVGDPIAFATNARWLGEGVLASKSVDDRVGCAMLVEIARALEANPASTLYLIGTVQEEIGSWGARYAVQTLQPDCVIALDTTGAQDTTTDRYRIAPIGGGPVLRKFQMAQPSALYPAVVTFPSRRLNQLIAQAAHDQNIPLNQDVYCHTFTDTSMAQGIHPGAEYANLLIPRRYSHSPLEVVDIADAERAVRIMVRLLHELEAKSS